MIGQIRERVLQIMDELERLSEHDYRTFELALALFLRTDKFQLENYITDSELHELEELIDESDTLMSDDLREQIDNIIESEEE